MSPSNFSANEFEKHPDANRYFYFAFQDDLLAGRSLSATPGDYSIAIEPAGELAVSNVAITSAAVADPITGDEAEAGKTIAGFFTGGVNASDYKLTVTAKDDGDPTQETLVLELILRVRKYDA